MCININQRQEEGNETAEEEEEKHRKGAPKKEKGDSPVMTSGLGESV